MRHFCNFVGRNAIVTDIGVFRELMALEKTLNFKRKVLTRQTERLVVSDSSSCEQERRSGTSELHVVWKV